MKEKQENIQASILDRLIDREPQLSRESAQYRLLNLNQMKAAVIRDLRVGEIGVVFCMTLLTYPPCPLPSLREGGDSACGGLGYAFSQSA